MDEKPMPQKALAWVSGPGRQRFHAAGLSGMGFRAAQPATDRGTHAAGLSGMGRPSSKP